MDWLKRGHNWAAYNERAIEVPLGISFLNRHGPNTVEVGAVLSYYKERGIIQHPIIDLYDIADTLKVSATEYSYLGKDVLSISTLEHLGKGDFGEVTSDKLPKLFWERMRYARTYLITSPLGYNSISDSLIFEADQRGVFYLKKLDINNNWGYSNLEEAKELKYGEPFGWANGLAVVTNDLYYLENDIFSTDFV
ncbi:MAG: hypothetical protein WC554_19355 [Clostridia bacterium]